MATLAKKYFLTNVFNQLLLIAEGGTYAKNLYVETVFLVMFFKVIKNL